MGSRVPRHWLGTNDVGEIVSPAEGFWRGETKGEGLRRVWCCLGLGSETLRSPMSRILWGGTIDRVRVRVSWRAVTGRGGGDETGALEEWIWGEGDVREGGSARAWPGVRVSLSGNRRPPGCRVPDDLGVGSSILWRWPGGRQRSVWPAGGVSLSLTKFCSEKYGSLRAAWGMTGAVSLMFRWGRERLAVHHDSRRLYGRRSSVGVCLLRSGGTGR
jgi:hypothetical protein